jgi:hypothetical protein
LYYRLNAGTFAQAFSMSVSLFFHNLKLDLLKIEAKDKGKLEVMLKLPPFGGLVQQGA